MIKKYLVILFLPLILCSQDEKLRIETINVFKEFQPQIAKSKKIGEQPIFNDTLSVNVISPQSILNKNLKFKETIFYKSPSKFRLHKVNNNLQKYFFINVGSHTFLNTKFHYNNGLSVVHNSGLYLEHNSEDYTLKSPHYTNLNGELKNSIKLYSNRFLNDKLLEISFQFTRKSGLYWAMLEDFPIDTISNFIGNLFNIQANLKQIPNSSFLKSIDLELYSFAHNYNRKELCLNSSLYFELEKALRKYSFSISYKMVHATLSPDWMIIDNLSFNPQIESGFYHDEMSDMLFKSQLMISGSRFVDYSLGLDFQYYKLMNMVRYSDSEFNDVKYLIFPNIKIFKNIKNNQRIEFLIEKDLKYHSFSSLFHNTSYIDPYYRNSVENEIKFALMYNKQFSDNISFFSSVNYNVLKNKLTPFLLSSDTEYSSLFTQHNGLMNPLSFYESDFNGVVGSSSLSFSKNQYDLLISGTVNMLNSSEHIDRNMFPLIELNSTLTVNLFENFDISSDAYFVGAREALRIPSLFISDSNLTYVDLESYFNLNLSMQYAFQNMIFSLDFNNLFGQRMEFFDSYYDDDRMKFRFGFLYHF